MIITSVVQIHGQEDQMDASTLRTIVLMSAIVAGTASPAWAASGRHEAAETGRSSDLVNRPGCPGDDHLGDRAPCSVVRGDFKR